MKDGGIPNKLFTKFNRHPNPSPPTHPINLFFLFFVFFEALIGLKCGQLALPQHYIHYYEDILLFIH